MKNADIQLLSPSEIDEARFLIDGLLEELDRIILGNERVHRMILIALLSRGHVLLEGVPGVGKTLLVKTLSRVLGLGYNRVQFTPDLMPSDILGNHILQPATDGTRQMVFQPGAVFTHILLADEINRASPKTQSALLEAMQEGAVTLLGQTRKLPSPFFVLATQNPIELEGTYPLPEAQIDRFLFKIKVDMARLEVLEAIISTRRHGTPPEPVHILNPQNLEKLFNFMERMFLPSAVGRYISRLVAASHPGSSEAPDKIKTYAAYGASPRAAIALAETARAHALMTGRPTAGFEDVKAVALYALNHRILLGYRARIDRIDSEAVVRELLDSIDETGIRLPENMEIR